MLDRDPELRRDDLRKHGLVSLTGRLRDGKERHAAVASEFDRDFVFRSCATAACFEVRRNADAPKLPAIARCAFAFVETIPVGSGEGVFHHRSEIT